MRIVIALGGNALLARGARPDADAQVTAVRRAVASLAPLARDHDVVLSHGNGPQVGLLALESAFDPSLTRPYPFDALGAQTQGLIGYWLLQELENACSDRPVAALVTQTLISASDPALTLPTKFVGASYSEREARGLADAQGWAVARDGGGWRRVVASPAPLQVVETPVIRLLVEAGAIVVCAGGGGVPVTRDEQGRLTGADAVVDKDLTSALLAEELDADVLLLLTDVAAVETDFGTPQARPIRNTSPDELRGHAFAAGSMGPKVAAACRFVERTGRTAAIGALTDTQAIVAGRAGTIVARERNTS